MKKIILSIAILWSFGYVSAQDNGIFDNETTTTTPSGNTREQIRLYGPGDKTLEVGFNPRSIFNASSTEDMFGLIGNQIRYRSFGSQGKAFRMGLGFHYVYLNNVIAQPSGSNPALHERINLMGISLMPGYEKHYRISRVFSPYTGFQFLVGYNRTSYTLENLNGSSVYEEKWINHPSALGNGSFDIGAGFITGFDYFIVSHLYLGLELGIGLQYSKLLNAQYINEDDSSLDEDYEMGSAFILSPGLTSGFIRLGWVF